MAILINNRQSTLKGKMPIFNALDFARSWMIGFSEGQPWSRTRSSRAALVVRDRGDGSERLCHPNAMPIGRRAAERRFGKTAPDQTSKKR
ncbi:hypothetical protein WOC76_07605 [Methylocystis sp. IM3]|uniref:hypothetical protein n=1 Tax=unclassified Methylocystis TaxID=2625913 RepID=UPI0030F7AF2E